MMGLGQLSLDSADTQTAIWKVNYCPVLNESLDVTRSLTSWADVSLDVFRETFREGGACIESGCARFRSVGLGLECLRDGGVVGGVSNVSSEETL